MPTSKGTLSKTHECPLCHELFARPGLHGHLRMLHKIEAEEARGMVERAQEREPETPREDPEPGTLAIAAIAGAGVLVLGVLLALHTRNVVGCTGCGTKLDVSEARAVGAQVVHCPECGALVQLP